MSEELYVDGLGLAPGVMETIVAIAAKEVEGVASVGSSTFTGLRSRFAAKPATASPFRRLPKPFAKPSPMLWQHRSVSLCRRSMCMSTASVSTTS